MGRRHSSEDASSVTTLQRYTQTLHQELRWPWFGSNRRNTTSKITEKGGCLIAQSSKSLNRYRCESVWWSQWAIFRRLTVFSVTCYSTWTQHGTIQMTNSKSICAREVPHEAATVGPWQNRETIWDVYHHLYTMTSVPAMREHVPRPVPV